MGSKRKLFSIVECQLITIKGMIKSGNQHFPTTTVITQAKIIDGCSTIDWKFVGEQDTYLLIDYLIIKKAGKVAIIVE